MPTPDTSESHSTLRQSCHRDFFRDPRVSKCPYSVKDHTLANLQPRTSSPPCALNDTDALTVVSTKCGLSPAFKRHKCGYHVDCPFLSPVRPRRQLTVVSYKEPPNLKPRKEEKEDPSKRSSRQTRCRRRPSEPHASEEEEEDVLPPFTHLL